MNTKILLTALIALIVGAGGGYLVASEKEKNNYMEMRGGAMHGMQGEMESMMGALEGKSGDAFDKAFLSEMIMHHQGAVLMAEAALENAAHEEIKTMARAIISAQTTEITQMQDWQAAWYGQ